MDVTDVLPWHGVGWKRFVERRTAISVVDGLLIGRGELLGLSAVSSVKISSAEIAWMWEAQCLPRLCSPSIEASRG